MTMRPGPRMASSVVSRCFQVVRGPMSPCRMVPKAPRMAPMCASSRTAVTGSEMLALAVIARLLCLLARERAGRLQKPASRFALEAVNWVCCLGLPPADALRIAPAGLLGLLSIGDVLQLARRKGTGEAGSRAP